MVSVTVWLRKEEVELIEEAADDDDSRNAAVRKAIRETYGDG